jgi:hypothetical protein
MIHQEITIIEIILLMKVVQEIHIVVLMMKEDIAVIASRTTITIVDIILPKTIQEEVMTVVVIILEVIMVEVIQEVATTNLQDLVLQEEITNFKNNFI